jgi:hypothetical protein
MSKKSAAPKAKAKEVKDKPLLSEGTEAEVPSAGKKEVEKKEGEDSKKEGEKKDGVDPKKDDEDPKKEPEKTEGEDTKKEDKKKDGADPKKDDEEPKKEAEKKEGEDSKKDHVKNVGEVPKKDDEDPTEAAKTDAEKKGDEDQLVHVQAILKRGEKGFNNWIGTLSVGQLELRVGELELQELAKTEVEKYLALVQSTETIGVCAKCEWKTGCEKCSYIHSLRYVMRHHQPSAWWMKAAGMALKHRPIRRFYSNMCIYIYIYGDIYPAFVFRFLQYV